MKKVTATLLGLIFLFPIIALASTASIVQGLWYSTDNILVGEPLRIYVAIRNSSNSDFSGMVNFYINGKSIGSQKVTALNNRIVESWTDWTPDFGTSTVKATLTDSQSGKTEALAEDTIFIDQDTDGDGIGNQKDTDDDGDGVSDKAELTAGTNPLVADQPTKAGEATSTKANDTESKVGLEQYLAPTPTARVLGAMTDNINNLKENLDNYRSKRDESLNQDQTSVKVNADGFGEIKRISKDERGPVAPKTPRVFGRPPLLPRTHHLHHLHHPTRRPILHPWLPSPHPTFPALWHPLHFLPHRQKTRRPSFLILLLL